MIRLLALILSLAAVAESSPIGDEVGHEVLFEATSRGNPWLPKPDRSVARKPALVSPDGWKEEAVLQFDEAAGDGRSDVAPLRRPLMEGEHLRLKWKARLQEGSHLRVGFGSGDGKTLDPGLSSYSVSLVSGGAVVFCEGPSCRIVSGLKHQMGEWQDYAIDYVVGSDLILVTVGKAQTAVKIHSEKHSGHPRQMNQVSVATGNESVRGQVQAMRAYAVMEPEIRDLPVFGRILWKKIEVPFIKPGPRSGFSGAGLAAVDGRIYLFGGFIPGGDGSLDKARRTSRWTFSYDPTKGTWGKLPDMPVRREYVAGTAGQGRIFFLGGGVQGPFVAHANVFELDVANPVAGWRELPSLSVPRTHISVGVVKNQLIAAGGNQYDGAVHGYAESTIRGTTETLNLARPDEGWSKRPSISGAPRGWSASVATENRFFLFGGLTYTPTRHRLKETVSFDPVRNVWAKHQPSPLAVSGWKGALFENRYAILVGGSHEMAEAEPHRWNAQPLVYDTKKNRWLRLEASALPPGGIYNDPAVAIIGNTIYVAGGEGANGSHYNLMLVGEIQPAR